MGWGVMHCVARNERMTRGRGGLSMSTGGTVRACVRACVCVCVCRRGDCILDG